MKNLRSKRCTLARIALAPTLVFSFALGSSIGLHAQEIELPTLPEFTVATDTFSLERPVQVRDVNGNLQNLVGMEDGQLIIEFPNMAGAQAIIPISDRAIFYSVDLPKEYNEWILEANEGKYNKLVNRMASLAAPLSRFLTLSPSKSNFNPIVLRYYEAIVKAGKIDEAVDMTTKMPWAYLSESFFEFGEALIYRTIREEQPEATELLLSCFYPAMREDEFAEMAFRVADALRTQGLHELTTTIYGSLAQSSDEILRERALLWAGYSSSVADNPAQARAILSSVEDLDREHENFMIYCLARGRLGYADDDVREGLRYLSRAMVLTSIEETFKPELYYLLIRGYRISGEEEAASRLIREFKIFYPENPWLLKQQKESAEI